MVHAPADIGIGLEMEDPVAALHGGTDDGGVPDVPRHQGESRAARQAGEKLPAARSEVVHDAPLRAMRRQPVARVAADEAGPAGDAGSPDGHGRTRTDMSAGPLCTTRWRSPASYPCHWMQLPTRRYTVSPTCGNAWKGIRCDGCAPSVWSVTSMVAGPKHSGDWNSSHWYAPRAPDPGMLMLSSVAPPAIASPFTGAVVTGTPAAISDGAGGSRKSGTSPQSQDGSPAK